MKRSIKQRLTWATIEQAAGKEPLTKWQLFWRLVLCGPKEFRRSLKARRETLAAQAEGGV